LSAHNQPDLFGGVARWDSVRFPPLFPFFSFALSVQRAVHGTAASSHPTYGSADVRLSDDRVEFPLPPPFPTARDDHSLELQGYGQRSIGQCSRPNGLWCGSFFSPPPFFRLPPPLSSAAKISARAKRHLAETGGTRKSISPPFPPFFSKPLRGRKGNPAESRRRLGNSGAGAYSFVFALPTTWSSLRVNTALSRRRGNQRLVPAAGKQKKKNLSDLRAFFPLHLLGIQSRARAAVGAIPRASSLSPFSPFPFFFSLPTGLRTPKLTYMGGAKGIQRPSREREKMFPPSSFFPHASAAGAGWLLSRRVPRADPTELHAGDRSGVTLASFSPLPFPLPPLALARRKPKSGARAFPGAGTLKGAAPSLSPPGGGTVHRNEMMRSFLSATSRTGHAGRGKKTFGALSFLRRRDEIVLEHRHPEWRNDTNRAFSFFSLFSGATLADSQ